MFIRIAISFLFFLLIISISYWKLGEFNFGLAFLLVSVQSIITWVPSLLKLILNKFNKGDC